MKDEIKEILECLKDTKDIQYSNCNYLELDIADQHLLYEYITNLQHDRDDLDDYNRHLYKKLTKLEKENDILKKQIDKTFMKKYPFLVENGIICRRNKEIEDLKRDREVLGKALKISGEGVDYYKSRNEKAIEYIKLGKTFDNEDVRKVVDKIQNNILNILQGSDNNER